MERNITFIAVYLFFSYLVCNSAFAVDPGGEDIKRQELVRKTDELRAKFIKHASQYVGIREKTGRNDGPEIERWLRVVGRKKGDAYCTAYSSTMFFDLNIPAPITGWSPAMFTGNVIYERKYVDWRKGFVFPVGSVFGFYYPDKGRVAHTGLIESSDWEKSMTIQANTSFTGAVQSDDDLTETVREGQGVARKWVRNQTIYIASDYIGGRLVMYDWRRSGTYSKIKLIDE